jgi:hypothetical protein
MKLTLVFISVLVMLYPLQAQIVSEPLKKDIYPYLERLSHRGVIELDDLFKPFSRKYIAEKLKETKSAINLLTDLEKEELEFFEKEYYWEINSANKGTIEDDINYFERDNAGRYRIFSYNDDIFKFQAKPLLGVDISYIEKNRNIHMLMGLSAYGYLLDKIGFNLDILSHNERGDALDPYREFTPQTGIIPTISQQGKDIGYSEVNSSVSVDWGWGNIIAAKEHIEFGYAKYGNIILSNKAPSFPHLRLQIKPADWFNFYYFHAWLSSNLVDSAKVSEYKRDIYVGKYFAWHALVITPFKGFDFSIGESLIYGDEIEFVYLMPVMFYFFADEYVTNKQGKPGDANQQIFLTISSKNHLPNTHLYGTLFVDEMTIGGINGSIIANPTYGGATSRRQRTQLGFTLGLSVTDLPIDNLTFSSEYTRINPFVYGHHDPAQTYTNNSNLIGHWMGHNADLLYLNMTYRIIRGLKAEVWSAFIRKGSDDYSEQYGTSQPDFLFGLKSIYKGEYSGFNLKNFGINLKYEWVHDLFFEIRYKKTSISRRQADGSYFDNQNNELYISINYGF